MVFNLHGHPGGTSFQTARCHSTMVVHLTLPLSLGSSGKGMGLWEVLGSGPNVEKKDKYLPIKKKKKKKEFTQPY